jgi:hypothetical protein
MINPEVALVTGMTGQHGLRIVESPRWRADARHA